jgi:hypothetical protein
VLDARGTKGCVGWEDCLGSIHQEER